MGREANELRRGEPRAEREQALERREPNHVVAAGEEHGRQLGLRARPADLRERLERSGRRRRVRIARVMREVRQTEAASAHPRGAQELERGVRGVRLEGAQRAVDRLLPLRAGARDAERLDARVAQAHVVALQHAARERRREAFVLEVARRDARGVLAHPPVVVAEERGDLVRERGARGARAGEGHLELAQRRAPDLDVVAQRRPRGMAGIAGAAGATKPLPGVLRGGSPRPGRSLADGGSSRSSVPAATLSTSSTKTSDPR